jgi:hypothetical protein
MIGNKIALILIFIFSMTCSSFGQKIKYKDYKNDISTKNYREKIETPKYSPIVAGVCNYVFPSSGYFYIGEPIRGACVFGSELVTSSVFVYGLVMSMSVDSETGQSPEGARAVMFSGMIATGLIQIWSIYDVVKIAKIKNLAYHDTKVSLMVKPDLFIVNQNDKNIASYGLRLSFNF